jgi:hypothetical protein
MIIILVFVVYTTEQPLFPLVLPPVIFDGQNAMENCRKVELNGKRFYEKNKTVRQYFSDCVEGVKAP